MRVVILPSARAAAEAVARFVAESIRTSPSLVLGLPTGRTPIPFYRSLVALHRRGRVDFRRVRTFNLDEFAGIPADHPGSYHAYMRRHLLDHVNLRPSHVRILDGMARPWRREVAQFEIDLDAAGGLDLALLGIGRNGHLGFNEPAGALAAATHRVKLSAASRKANADLFGGRWRDVPTHALSMGIGTLLGARTVILLASGADKARIVARAFTGPVTTQVPASLLQVHPNAVAVLDRAAAARLP
ncbi:MAG: glucosamine-6-phosphate deaminase [Vicinamibacterales bacterium]